MLFVNTGAKNQSIIFNIIFLSVTQSLKQISYRFIWPLLLYNFKHEYYNI